MPTKFYNIPGLCVRYSDLIIWIQTRYLKPQQLKNLEILTLAKGSAWCHVMTGPCPNSRLHVGKYFEGEKKGNLEAAHSNWPNKMSGITLSRSHTCSVLAVSIGSTPDVRCYFKSRQTPPLFVTPDWWETKPGTRISTPVFVSLRNTTSCCKSTDNTDGWISLSHILLILHWEYGSNFGFLTPVRLH